MSSVKSLLVFFFVILSQQAWTVSLEINLDKNPFALAPPDPNFAKNGDPRPYLIKNPGRQEAETFQAVIDIDTPYQFGLGQKILRDDPTKAGTVDRSLEFEIFKTYDASSGHPIKKEKVMIYLTSMEQPAVESPGLIDITSANTRRYFSFEIFFPEDFEAPPAPSQLIQQTYLILAQAVQNMGASPPFVIGVEGQSNPLGPIVLSFLKRSDPTYGVVSTVIKKVTVARGKWNKVLLQLQPASVQSGKTGQIAMWLNDQQVFVSTGPWGYQPASTEAKYLNLSFGLYRGSQSRHQRVRYRNIKVAHTADELK